MRYDECLDFLADLGHELRGRRFSLDATCRILGALGHPERKFPTAIVAGTNGKGSTSAMLSSILQAAGFRTGLYTSPHLVRVNERIRVDGEEIADDDFASAFSRVRNCVHQLIAQQKLTQQPSFFEYLTATAFEHFARVQAGFVVLEVGIGGRLDATNVTTPAVAIITNVALDHQEFLGNTLTEIAAEKAGVIKPGRPVVSTCQEPNALAVIRAHAIELRSEFIEASTVAAATNLREHHGFYRFRLTLAEEEAGEIALPLAGKVQVHNALAAAAAAWRLRQEGFQISGEAIRAGLERTAWPGRLEVVETQPLVVLDGAHNPAAAREIAAFAREQWRGRTLRLIYATMRDKDIGAMSELLFSTAEEIYLTQPAVARAASPQEILASARVVPERVILEPDPALALQKAISASAPQDVILAAGSLFLVGALKKALLERRLPMARTAPADAVARLL